jgi:hypothetical protein
MTNRRHENVTELMKLGDMVIDATADRAVIASTIVRV